MTEAEARRIIESLRTGIPPQGYVRAFTVGRRSEIERLDAILHDTAARALLLLANYGAGKTHLLRYARELGLSQGYAVCSVVVAANSAVRFNRMDQVLGASWRGLELPSGLPGPRNFMNTIVSHAERAKSSPRSDVLWSKLTSDWEWDYSDVLESEALWVAIRAWATGNADAQDLVEDYLRHPWNYKSQRKRLYNELVLDLRTHFRDPRIEFQFYADGVFDLSGGGYAQSWSMLRDINRLVQAAGCRGLILLFDEFEDVITNLRNISYQQAAFWNLFQLFRGNQFNGHSFFAVTPEFVQKCKAALLERSVYDFDYAQFDRLPTFEMAPLAIEDVFDLVKRIADVHGIAYGWPASQQMSKPGLRHVVEREFRSALQDRTRRAITEAVKFLDAALDEAD